MTQIYSLETNLEYLFVVIQYDFEKGSLFFKKGKKRVPGERKIEDKLIEYGESVKKKRAEKKIEKLKVKFLFT